MSKIKVALLELAMLLEDERQTLTLNRLVTPTENNTLALANAHAVLLLSLQTAKLDRTRARVN